MEDDTDVPQERRVSMTGANHIQIAHTARAGCLVATVTGHLGSQSYRTVRDGLVKLAVEQPRALIVDIDELEVGSEPALTVFASAWSRVSIWPEVPILLVASDEVQRQRLRRRTVAHFVPVYRSVEEAIAAVRMPPRRRRRTAEYTPAIASSALARTFVRQTCEDWNCEEWLQDALCVASELVENAVKHAGTNLQLRLESRSGLLTIAVRDGDPHMAVIRQTAAGQPVGYGLQIVSDLARAWGSSPDLGGGKVVWAVLTGRDWFRKYPAWQPRP